MTTDAYGQRALDEELSQLRQTTEGGRSDALNRVAYRFAQLVAVKRLDEGLARRGLDEAAKEIGLEKREAASTIQSGWKKGLAAPREADKPQMNGEAQPARKVIARYLYADAEGNVLYAKARWSTDDPSKYSWQHQRGSGWVAGQGTKKRVPYRLRSLLDSDPDEDLFLAEGEKHADKLGSNWSLLASSHKDWRADFAEHVAGRRVIIMPDRDDSGERQAAKTARLVLEAGGRPYLVRLPRLSKPGDDVMDWDGTREELLALAEAEFAKGPWQAPGQPDEDGKDPASGVKDKRRAFERGISAAALMATHFEPLRYAVSGYLAEGATLLAGRPKVGKSWLALGIAVSVASNQPVFGSLPVRHGDVLYLALEDSQRRLKTRLGLMGIQKPPERLTLVTNWPDLDHGCIDELEAWADTVEKPVLIIIDVLKQVRGQTRPNESVYDSDYRAMSPFAAFGRERGIAVLVLHHVRKGAAEDPLETVSGTNGLTGAADAISVLKPDTFTLQTGQEAANTGQQTGQMRLYLRGRDVDEIEWAVRFSKAPVRFELLGDASEIGRTSQRHAILFVLRNALNPLTVREISDLIGKSNDAVRKTCTRMAQDLEIEKIGHGTYTPVRCPVSTTDNPNRTERTGGVCREGEEGWRGRPMPGENTEHFKPRRKRK